MFKKVKCVEYANEYANEGVRKSLDEHGGPRLKVVDDGVSSERRGSDGFDGGRMFAGSRAGAAVAFGVVVVGGGGGGWDGDALEGGERRRLRRVV